MESAAGQLVDRDLDVAALHALALLIPHRAAVWRNVLDGQEVGDARRLVAQGAPDRSATFGPPTAPEPTLLSKIISRLRGHPNVVRADGMCPWVYGACGTGQSWARIAG
jgi:hypothetical protein